MSEEIEISIDSLVKNELDGKSLAISRYDNIIWKIRAGYASMLYGAIGVVSTLVYKNILDFNSDVEYAIVVLVIGFSLFGAGMDFSFMTSKLRVIEYRDQLIEFSYERAKVGIWKIDSSKLLDSLVNSGERKEKINWEKRPGLRRLAFFYGGTCIVCILVVEILAG